LEISDSRLGAGVAAASSAAFADIVRVMTTAPAVREARRIAFFIHVFLRVDGIGEVFDTMSRSAARTIGTAYRLRGRKSKI
jgi:hypothetical protein